MSYLPQRSECRRSRIANGACMCEQADSSLSVRGEVVQVSSNRICQIYGDTVARSSRNRHERSFVRREKLKATSKKGRVTNAPS
ncbi:unnamed protein product [Sphagnum compactum]